jgi:hypothetical protein
MPQLAGFARPSLHLPDADPRTTLSWMVREARLGLEDVELRLFAEQLVKKLFPHDYLSEYVAMLQWVRTHIRYVRDPADIEQVKTPRAVLETETGDCDDQSVLVATLCATLGAKTRFVAGAFQRSGSGEPIFGHVWAEAFDPTSRAWIVLDPVPGRNVSRMIKRLVGSIVAEVS